MTATKHHRLAFASRPSRPTNPVNVGFGGVGRVVVDHGLDAIDVDPASGHIGCHQHIEFIVFEFIQRSNAVGLSLVAMNRCGLHSGFDQSPGNRIGTVFGAGEHQSRAGSLGFDKVTQQSRLVSLSDKAD